MISKHRRRILEALEHYRCPNCGSPANFREVELSVTSWNYNPKKGRWVIDGCESVEEHSGDDPHDILVDAYEVRCRNCDKSISWPDGTFVNAFDGFDDWLDLLADDWEAQKEERVKLAAELDKAKQDINPVGHLAELEDRLKALDTITCIAATAETSA